MSVMTEGKEQIEIPPPAMIKPMRLWTGDDRVFDLPLIHDRHRQATYRAYY